MTNTIDWAYHWTHDKSVVLAQLAERRSELTICLKTKDDAYFLERWITHHADIVGLHNLVIFDNQSSSEAVRSVYEKFRPDLLVVQFDEYYDQLHHVAAFPELYHSLKHSTAFCAFLDTDEFLVLIENDRFLAGPEIVEFIQSCGDVNWLPATWLPNVFRSETLFGCGSDISVLIEWLRFGKPVVRAKAVGEGYICHNFQLFSTISSGKTHTNLFLLHMRNLLPEQRIPILMNRLLAKRKSPYHDDVERNFMSEGDDLKVILAKKDDHLPPASNLRAELADLRRIVMDQEDDFRAADCLGAGQMRLCPDGNIEYYSDTEKQLFRRFLTDPDAMTQSAFTPDPGH